MKSFILRSASLVFFLAAASLISGCASVKPWEKEILSRKAMTLDSEPHLSASDDHIYFSREAAKGGRAFGGGGCGCN